MRRSNAPDISGTDSVANQQVAARDPEVVSSEQATSLAEPRATRSDGHTPDGSIGYRIAALVAMLLLAFASLVVWYFFH